MLFARLVSLFCLLAAVSGSVLAQSQPKPSDYGIKSKKALLIYQDVQKDLRFKDWSRAIDQCAEALALEPNFAHAHFSKGIAHYERSHPQAPNTKGGRDVEEARVHLHRALALNAQAFPRAEFILAELAMREMDYAQAEQRLKTFLARKDNTKENIQSAEALLRRSSVCRQLIENPVQFEPQNMGPAINTPGDEYMPNVTADEGTLFFTTRREGNLGGWNRLLNGYGEDFYLSRRQKDGSWSLAEPLGPPVNTEENEGAASFSQDGQWVYFTGCNRRDGVGSCDLYVARILGNRWTEPLNMSEVINSPHWESHPCISPDGKRLFFCSVRPGGEGGHDIWMAEQAADGGWMPPRSLGKPINTPGNEYYPFLAADGKTLYFSSDTHPGMGGIDLFMSKRQPDGSWSAPVNLGFPLNTSADEQALAVSASGERGYIGTTRTDGFGKSDIYAFQMDPRIRPDIATYVRGRVEDSLTRKPVGAVVQVVHLGTGDTVRQVESNSVTGRFLLSLPLEEEYAAYVDARGYLFYSQHFSLKGLSGQQYFDILIRLQPIQQGATVRLDNIFFDFDQATLKAESRIELEKLLRFLQANPTVKVEIRGHTDNEGTDSYNLRLSDQRAKAVAAWLLERGIPADRLQAKGYGETEPVAPNDTDASRARNRRTEFRIVGM
ncbi:MAG: PD40 domain-containing protein [Bacteroidetes bacterium]|nr:PD40 domain-containing protein [Bacteroidota bacterium]